MEPKYNDKILCNIVDRHIISSMQGFGILIFRSIFNERYEGTYYKFNSKGNLKHMGHRAILKDFICHNLGQATMKNIDYDYIELTYPEYLV